jgi:hypothetical protein
MLTKKQLRKNDQHACKLLGLPREILLEILKQSGLDLFDIACLMLTCKEVANLVLSLNIDVAGRHQLQSEKEMHRFEQVDPEDLDYKEQLSDLDMLFRGRLKSFKVQKFFDLLDFGWNRSESRMCNACRIFVPTSKTYWEKKAQNYLYNSITPAAVGYRVMADCKCDCQPASIINGWIKHGESEPRELSSQRCPDCMFRETKVQYPTCDRCDEVNTQYGHANIAACGCAGCKCDWFWGLY